MEKMNAKNVTKLPLYQRMCLQDKYMGEFMRNTMKKRGGSQKTAKTVKSVPVQPKHEQGIGIAIEPAVAV